MKNIARSLSKARQLNKTFRFKQTWKDKLVYYYYWKSPLKAAWRQDVIHKARQHFNDNPVSYIK